MITNKLGFFLTNQLLGKRIETQIFKNFSINSKINSSSSIKENSKSPIAWDLFASVCIERMPIITCDMNDLENRYSNLINELNIRNSLQSDHELRHLKDLEIAEQRKTAGNQENREVVIETAVDYEDQCLKQLRSFKFADRQTNNTAETLTGLKKPTGVLNNIDRILDKKLILLVYDAEKSKWALPEIKYTQTDPSLRHTAERSVYEKVNEQKDGLSVTFLGNAPAGIYKSKPVDNQGGKHYIFKAQYKSGGELLAKSRIEYAWIRKDELKDFIDNPEYLECLNNLILDF